jgi:3-phenylpropionate/trans-cinnamate dioxygenase ferredoxin reductase subunit
MESHFVIVGAGQAGAALALRLRKQGFTGKISMFGLEPDIPYQRPPLSKKYLLGEWERDRLYLRPPGIWKDNGIALHTGCLVEAIDIAQRTLTCRGETIRWDKLALATGASPRRLPNAAGDHPAVFEMRGLADVDRLRPHFVKGRHLVIIGGGFLGLEVAAAAIQMSLKVTIIEAAERVLARVVCEAASCYFESLHRQNGVEILAGHSVAAIDGPKTAPCVVLADGTRLTCDAVLVGIGSMPNTVLAERAGLTIQNGILADQLGRTSAEDVWAAGDCAAFPFRGEITRLESVQNAIDQAESVADDMLGQGRPYNPMPWFWSDQYDVKLQIAGWNKGYTDVAGRRNTRGESYWYFKGERLLAVDSINDGRSFMIAKTLLRQEIPVPKELVADPGFDLQFLTARSSPSLAR